MNKNYLLKTSKWRRSKQIIHVNHLRKYFDGTIACITTKNNALSDNIKNNNENLKSHERTNETKTGEALIPSWSVFKSSDITKNVHSYFDLTPHLWKELVNYFKK